MKKIKKPLFTLMAVTLLFTSISCGQSKTNRELFNEQLETNIIAGMKPLINVGVDSITARKTISCVLEKLYQIDSTYFLKSVEQQKEIYLKNEVHLKDCINLLTETAQSVNIMPL